MFWGRGADCRLVSSSIQCLERIGGCGGMPSKRKTCLTTVVISTDQCTAKGRECPGSEKTTLSNVR